jgi:hypothetical protein
MSGYIGDSFPSKLGGGIPGFQPKLIGGSANSNGSSGVIGSNLRSLDRLVLRKSLLNSGNLRNKLGKNNSSLAITPFRLAFNAGDINNTINDYPMKSLGATTQLNSSNLSRINANKDGIRYGSSGYSGNPKYVYDSSDYIKFKKLKSKLVTYNDSSYGGANNGSYSFLRRVRR